MAGPLTEMVRQSSGSPPPKVNCIQNRIVDRLDHRLVIVLTVVGFGLPLVGYFSFVSHYGVNVVVGDQWNDVTVIRGSYQHFFDWGQMWAQANENRIFFPNVIVILLAHFGHFNIQTEEWISALMLSTATGLFIWAHKRRSPSMPWLYYCPVAFLLFTFVQWENTFWGFQMAWYLVMVSLAVAIVFLDRIVLTWPYLLAAMMAAVVGSFSSLQGLLIWIVGLVLLYFRRRSWSVIGIWVAGAAASSVWYFHNLSLPAAATSSFNVRHPLFVARFFLVSIGDVLGQKVNIGASTSETAPMELFGLLIVVLAVGTIVICGFRRDENGGSPVGVALICFGLLFAAIVADGRAYMGIWEAGSSRYTTFDILILVGTYLALLGRRPSSRMLGTGWAEALTLPIVRVLVVLAIAVQIVFAIPNGIQNERSNHSFNVKAASVLRNIDRASNGDVRFYLFIFESDAFIRQRARVLQEHHLSVFSND